MRALVPSARRWAASAAVTGRLFTCFEAPRHQRLSLAGPCSAGQDVSSYITRALPASAAMVTSFGCTPAAVLAFTARAFASDAKAEPTCRRARVVDVSGDIAEELSDMLIAYGAQSTMVEEHRPPGAPEQEIFDDGSGESGVWDRCDVVAFFALEDDAAEAVRCAADAVELPDARFELEEIANEGWVEQIKASYVPLRIADDLYIVPEWCEPEDPAALNIVMQPGVAFGTGEHPTTRLCLQHLLRSRQWLAGKRVMDYGTGSGVLAIAALKLGAAHATGTDTDSLAVQSAQRNGELSGVPPAVFEVYQCGAALDDPEPVERATGKAAAGGYDLVVANILRGPLVELQPRLASYVRSGGRLALSGILAEQAAEVVAAYSRDFADFQTSVDSTWALVTAVRKC